MTSKSYRSFGYSPEAYESYDESEDFLEDDEADDEDDESYAYEGDDEADDEADDESYYEDDEADDEDDESYAYEADDEADDESYYEDDEADDESYSAEGIGQSNKRKLSPAERRRRNNQVLARHRATQKRRLINQQRQAVNNARMTQQRIRDRLQKVVGVRNLGTKRIQPAKGSGYVTAILPNGRKTKMMLSPAPASRKDINHLTNQININDAKQAQAIKAQAKSLVQLKATQATAVKSLSAQILKSSQGLSKQIADGDAKLDKRISTEVLDRKLAHDKHRAEMLKLIKGQQRRAMLNSILIATAMPFFAAYGEKNNPAAKNNLILGVGLGVAMLGDDVVGHFAGKNKIMRTGASAWSYLAPFAYAGGNYWYFKDKQHERFVTDVTPVDNTGTSLQIEIIKAGSDYKKTFDSLETNKVPVVATIIEGPAVVVSASVTGGKLTLKTFTADGTTAAAAKVAWAVDVKPPEKG